MNREASHTSTMSPSSLLLSCLLIACTWLILLTLRTARRRAHHTKLRLPPGPRGLPIIGTLHLLGPRPYRQMRSLAATYGPVMRLRMGSIPAVIISSPAAAQELFKCNDLAMAGRPLMEAGEILNYRSSTIGIVQYGPYWRDMRKLFTSELFSSHKVHSFAPIRAEELRLLVTDLRNSSTPVDMSAKVSYLFLDITCRMVFGDKMEPEEVREYRWALRKGSALLSALNLKDFVPFVARLGLDLQGLKGKLYESKRALRGLLDIIERRMNRVSGGGGEKALVDILMEYMKLPEGEEHGFNRNHVKVHLVDVLGTTVETTHTTTEWAFVELLRHPATMKKVKQELSNVVGTDRLVEESDLLNLPYLEMVLKESMRLHPPLPLLIPHMALDDFTLQGFDVPRGTHVVVNAWAINHDPAVWPEPERFWPERFEGSKVDYRGRDFELIPFGSGRRMCAGMQLGMTMVRLVLAQLVHCFDWEMPEGVKAEELSMEETYGITAPRAERLVALPVYRLNCQV